MNRSGAAAAKAWLRMQGRVELLGGDVSILHEFMVEVEFHAIFSISYFLIGFFWVPDFLVEGDQGEVDEVSCCFEGVGWVQMGAPERIPDISESFGSEDPAFFCFNRESIGNRFVMTTC